MPPGWGWISFRYKDAAPTAMGTFGMSTGSWNGLILIKMKKQILQKHRMILGASVSLFLFAGLFPAVGQPLPATNTNLVRLPDLTHVAEPLPDGILAWDALTKAVGVTNGQMIAKFAFSFTNITTNVVTILNTRSSCGCTTVEMPPVPWSVSGGAAGEIRINVNLAGKTGALFKSIQIMTDKGTKDLALRINIPPPFVPKMSEAQRAAGVAAAKVDRQAVFKGDCASCHRNNIPGKYGPQLYAAACAICHEANPRASMVPDLHHLTDAAGKPLPTSEEFWRATIAAGKEGTLMPAFASAQGGPLNDMQIASLAAYLNAANPSRVPRATAK